MPKRIWKFCQGLPDVNGDGVICWHEAIAPFGWLVALILGMWHIFR